jgi:hypothetical protein
MPLTTIKQYLDSISQVIMGKLYNITIWKRSRRIRVFESEVIEIINSTSNNIPHIRSETNKVEKVQTLLTNPRQLVLLDLRWLGLINF